MQVRRETIPLEQRRRRVARTIVERREELGMRQVDLARKVEVSQPTVCHWETGAKMPRDRHLEALESALALPAGGLFRVAHPGPLAVFADLDLGDFDPDERALIEAALALIRRRRKIRR